MSSLKPIKCRAAVMYDYQKPLVLEDVIIDAPKGDQVRVKLVSTGVCLSDVVMLSGKAQLSDAGQQLPIVLGHESAAIVESVGEDVTSVKPGDHVLTTYVNRCKNCAYCLSPTLTNICAKENAFILGLIPNKKLVNGTALQGYCGFGTYSEYALLKSNQVDRIDSSLKLENLSLITCATGTGYGAARYIAKVIAGTSVAIWGSGAIGLNAIFGAKLNGAKNIIAIDSNNARKQPASEFGCTEFVNPNELNKPVSEYLLEKYGGVDYAIDCNGEPSNLPNALKSLTPFGTFTFAALTYKGTQLVHPTGDIAPGKKIFGGFFGGKHSDEIYSEVLELYKEGKYELDKMITFKFKLDQINEAIETVTSGRSITTLIVFD